MLRRIRVSRESGFGTLISEVAIAQRAINNKHDSIGGDTGLLGIAVEELKATPNSTGFFQRYKNGMIYWSSSTDAHEIHGAILGKWSSLGYERSLLGFPLEDEKGTPDGIGRFNRFQNGMIYWTPSTNAHEIHGAILNKWSSLGYELSFLGYPVSDEGNLGIANGRFSNFQRGQIAWSPESGADVCSTSFRRNNGGGITPQGVPGDGVPIVRRRVAASAHMEITDDETFGSNEHGAADNQTDGFVTNRFPRSLLVLTGKAGGEVRVELKLDASVLSPEGDISVNGTVKLFEGTSEESDDLDGTADINFAVPRDEVMNQIIHIRNANEGGDFADIRLLVSNSAA